MSQFCYLPSEFTINQRENLNFLIDASTPSLPIYFALKSKHEYEMLGWEKFVDDVRLVVTEFASGFDMVAFPQSRYSFLKQITRDLTNVVEIKKRSKDEICLSAQQTTRWNKQERISAQASWDAMGDTFTINTIKSNKRKDYIPHLFHKVDVPVDSRILLLDDFVMSGNTIKAMAMALSIDQYSIFGVFHQTAYACQ